MAGEWGGGYGAGELFVGWISEGRNDKLAAKKKEDLDAVMRF